VSNLTKSAIQLGVSSSHHHAHVDIFHLPELQASYLHNKAHSGLRVYCATRSFSSPSIRLLIAESSDHDLNGAPPTSEALARISRLPQELQELLILHTLVPATLVSIFWRLVSFTIPLRKNFHPGSDIPTLTDKVILVTGSNTGIGKETVLQLARHKPARVFVAARNKAKALEAIQEIESAAPDAQISFIQLDLTSFTSIRDAVKNFNSQCSRLDILINNAGGQDFLEFDVHLN
jgi:hypothetical protein